MNKLRRSPLIFLLTASLALLASCGETGGPQVAEGGIGGTGIASGPISQFGSVFVNGVEFETTNATITFGDEPATEADLKLGMHIDVQGEINDDGVTGTADTISFIPTLVGKVSNLDLDSNRFTIGDIVVQGDPLTILDGLKRSDFENGLTVTVSGTVSHDNIVYADYIRLGIIKNITSVTFPPENGNALLTVNDWVSGDGIISHVNTSTKEFESKGWTVSYDEKTNFTNGSAHEILPGVHIIVSGIKSGDLRIEAQWLTFVVDATETLTGPVTAVDIEQKILYGGVDTEIYITNNTIMEDSSSQAVKYFGLDDIHAGDKVKVYTYFSGSALVAGRVTRID